MTTANGGVPAPRYYDYDATFRQLVGDVENEIGPELVAALIEGARELVLTRRHPFSADPLAEPWEPRYDGLTCQIAAFMWEKMGAEGQTASRENGIYRAWDANDAYVPAGLLRRVVPIAAVP